MPVKERVLIIEDNIGFRFLFRDTLEYLGHEVLEADDGETGCAIAKSSHPNLILLDLMIPKLNGFEVLKRLKADPLTRDIPVAVLSVLHEANDIQRSYELGAGDYIVKGSASPEQIAQRCCRLLAKT